MSIWDNLFGRNSGYDTSEALHYQFGRYSDAYKSRENNSAWNQALDSFESQSYMESFEALFTYLRDPALDNVKWKYENDILYFEFLQGSKRVNGFADQTQFRASARIAQMTDNNIYLFKRLTDMNFAMKYSRFSLDEENCLCVVFDTPVDDASPYKLYHALKEIAIRADKQDDLLLEEFKDILIPVEITHLRQVSENEKATKENFLRKKIESVNDYLSTGELNPEEYPGAVAYLLLDLVYRLDYLLTPEGYTMEALERMHRLYFAQERQKQGVSFKNVRLLGELQSLLLRAPLAFSEELYVGISTFGITLPVSHDRVISLINNELPNMSWYQENGYTEVACAIPGYIVGYAMFNYAVPPPDRDLLQLYYRISENTYFQQLGFKQDFRDSDGRPNRRNIRTAINDITQKHQDTYPLMRPALGSLNFDSFLTFSRSFMYMIRELDLSKP